MTLLQVLVTELMKLKQSRVPLATAAAMGLGPLGIALFMWILREPERAESLGLLGTKANLSGLEATWPSYLGIAPTWVGMGGMLLLTFIIAWVFGREYAEGTAKNLLALPVPRSWFVAGKLVVGAVWWLVLVAAALGETLGVGAALGLPGFSADLAVTTLERCVVVAGITFLLAPVTAWVTTWGRGYLPPIGLTLALLVLGNVFGKTGWGMWFPWSIVPTFIGTLGQPTATVAVGSWIVLGGTFVGGIVGTVMQVRGADNTQ